MKLTDISVAFSCTVPTQAYGNVGVNVQWSGTLDENETPEEATKELFNRIRLEVAKGVKPIAEAKLKAVQPVIQSLPKNERDALLQSLGANVWINTVAPELEFGG